MRRLLTDEARHRHHAAKRIAGADVAAGEAAAAAELVDDGTSYALTAEGNELKIGNARVLIADIAWNKGIVHILAEELP